MPFWHKLFDLKSLRWAGAGGAMALVAWVAAGAAPAGGLSLPWRNGLMETLRYTMEERGQVTGEFEQRLYGEAVGGAKRCRLRYELARSVDAGEGIQFTGRVTMEVTFNPQTFDLIQRTDHYAGGPSEGRTRFTRIPGGLRIRSESSFEGIPRETEEKDVEYPVDGPLIDEVLFAHIIRSLPMEEGHTFELETINPALKDVIRTKGMVRGVETMEWNGKPVKVRRVETSTPEGITTYFVGTGEDRLVYRYLSPRGEAYILQPAREDASG